jgi:DNA-3-methyladenine glycosylase
MKRLNRDFYCKNSVTVAKKLLGKIIMRKYKGETLSGKIVEVEAYRGKDDSGSHAYKKKTKRNSIMFGKPGYAYVYLCYGNHYLLNVVAEKEGNAGAVLIRAVEPLKGIDKMTNGPGKLTKAFFIDKKFNGEDIVKSKELFIVENSKKEKFTIKATSRIGIKTGLDKKWRFYIKGNKFVSKVN